MMRRFRSFPQIGGKRGGIPSGWVEVEWLESTDTQYIDTGVELAKDVGYELKWDFKKFAEEYTSNRRFMCFWGNNAYWSSGLIYRVNSFTAVWGDVTQFAFAKPSPVVSDSVLAWNFKSSGKAAMDNVSVVLPNRTEFSPSVKRNLLFFCWWDGTSNIAKIGTNTWAAHRVYGAKVSKGVSVVRDLVPVRDAVTNEGAMCDILTGEIYRNRGTGAFIVGPDKRQYTARDYVQDGLLALWDGIENAGWGVHDAAAVGWKDLSGNGRDFANIVTGANSWSDTHLNVAQNTRVAQSWSISGIKTIEVCGYAETNAYMLFSFGFGRRMFCILPTNNRGFQFGSGAPSMFQPFNTDWTATATFDGEDDYPAHTYYKGEEKPHTAGTSSWALSGNVWIPNASYPFRGKVRCIRIYNRALTDAEVAANFAVDRARFNIA